MELLLKCDFILWFFDRPTCVVRAMYFSTTSCSVGNVEAVSIEFMFLPSDFGNPVV